MYPKIFKLDAYVTTSSLTKLGCIKVIVLISKQEFNQITICMCHLCLRLFVFFSINSFSLKQETTFSCENKLQRCSRMKTTIHLDAFRGREKKRNFTLHTHIFIWSNIIISVIIFLFHRKTCALCVYLFVLCNTHHDPSLHKFGIPMRIVNSAKQRIQHSNRFFLNK